MNLKKRLASFLPLAKSPKPRSVANPEIGPVKAKPVASQQDQAAERLIKQAEGFHRKKEWSRALTVWRDLHKTPPANKKLHIAVLVGNSRTLRLSSQSHIALAVIEKGALLYPLDSKIQVELAAVLLDLGYSRKAIDTLEVALERKAYLPAYVLLIEALCAEGFHDRAQQAFIKASTDYPGHEHLAGILHGIKTSFGSYNQIGPDHVSNDAVTHLFSDRRSTHGIGKAALTIRNAPVNAYVQNMLDFGEYISPLQENDDPSDVDAFLVWGATDAASHRLCRKYAAALGRPLLTIEYGFVSSFSIALQGSVQHSLFVCEGPIYFDSTQVTAPEKLLNDAGFRLSDQQFDRARACIDKLISTKVTKYNHAPIIDMAEKLGPKQKPRILLVDQRYGDKSVKMGLASAESFRRMVKAALERTDHEILVKLHPDAVTGGAGSYLRSLVDEFGPEKFVLIDYEVNPYSIFDAVDEVFVVVSQFGFEALLAGKKVSCFGVPFYAGWGLTNDMTPVPRRRNIRSVEEIFHVFYFLHSRYWVPGSSSHELEDLIDYIYTKRDSVGAVADSVALSAPPAASAASASANILMIVPSGQNGASARYMQTLAESLLGFGNRVMIMAEGRVRWRNGVRWVSLEFDGAKLSQAAREKVVSFRPDIVYMNGVRVKAQRAALEVMYLTGARLTSQSEDDDVDVFEYRSPEGDSAHLTMLDKPSITPSDLARFLVGLDWDFTMRVLENPQHTRWIEPLLRMLTNRMSELHTAIWHPFADRLAAEYGKPVLVVPPVARASDFDRMPLSSDERAEVLARYGIDGSRTVFFMGGSIYVYSNDFQIFLRSLNLLAARYPGQVAVVVAGRSGAQVDSIMDMELSSDVQRIFVNSPSDIAFLELTKACDVCCSPGTESRFELYRLPSRLVKAMAMGKPVLLGECGFGGSLKNGMNAIVTNGADAAHWADAMEPLMDPALREQIGIRGRWFAEANFDSGVVAQRLHDAFISVMQSPRPTSILGVDRSPVDLERDQPPEFIAATSPLLTNLVEAGMQSVSSVLHVGAGECLELNDYIGLGASKIRLVEPSSASQASLAEKSGSDGKIEVLRVAVGSVEGQSDLHRYEAGGAAASIIGSLHPIATLESAYCGLKKVDVEHVTVVTLDSVLSDWDAGPDGLLVLEAAGVEAEVVEASDGSLLRKARWVIVAVSNEGLFGSGSSTERVQSHLSEAGFSTKVYSVPSDDLFDYVVAWRR